MGPDPVGFEISSQQREALVDPTGSPARRQVALEFDAVPDGTNVSAALKRLVDRHEILRTRFVRSAGSLHPLQVVEAAVDVPVTEMAGTGGPKDIDEATAVAWAEPLDAEHGPLLRAVVVTRPDGSGAVVLTSVAAVADVMTLRGLLADLGSLDGAADDEPLQYADYTAWQAEQSAAVTDAVGAELDLPAAILPTSGVSAVGAGAPRRPRGVALGWVGDVAPALNAVAGAAGAEPSDVWVAAWAALVHRLTGVDRLVLGEVTDGRTSEELSGAVGPYAWTRPLVVDIEPEASLRTLTAAVHRQRADTEHAVVPSRASGDGSDSVPLASLVVGTQADLSVDVTPPDGDSYQLLLVLGGGDTTTTAALWSHPGRISDDHADQVAATFATLTRVLSNDPDAPVDSAPAFDDATDAAWLAGLQGPMTDIGETTVLAQFESQVRRTPDRTAVTSGDGSLTYAELDRRANALARTVAAGGADQTAPVAIVMERSIDQLVSILAAWKAGAPHVCLSPDQPPVRLLAQLEHAGSVVLLTTDALRGTLPAFEGSVVVVDRFADEADTAPAGGSGPDDLAYLVFTSGSTGDPKGVTVTHRSLNNYVSVISDLVADVAGYDAGLTFAVVTALNTDLGNTCLYPALVSGGTVSLVPIDAAMDPVAYAAYNAAHPADVLKITPSHLDSLLIEGASVLPAKVLFTGGEASTWDLLDRVRSLRDCRIVNHYGPSETTVGSLIFETATSPGDHFSRRTVPIGRPIANTQVHVVDEQLRHVAPGSAGELLIGGAGVARGYWRDDERTAVAFVDDPFTDASGARLYRTGDLVRYLPDGSLEFLGRNDGQVKVRGHRVETGEVEEALRSHREVQRAAVVLREDTSGDKRLVAYIVSPYIPGPSPSSLREYLRERLPEYMVPSSFVELDILPLAANGKLDRRALPEPGDDDLDGDREFVEPSTETEQTIAGVFSDLLGVERVGASDDFFALGGHSLLATQAIARIRSAFDIDLEVHTMFTEPTVAALATAVDERRGSNDAELAALLREIDNMSDEEAERLLATETGLDPPP